MFVCCCCCGFVVVAVVVLLFVCFCCLFVCCFGGFNYLLCYIFMQVLRVNTELTKPEIVKRTSPF